MFSRAWEAPADQNLYRGEAPMVIMTNRKFNLRKVKTTGGVALGALANVTVQTGALVGTADGAYRLMSTNLLWSIKNQTVGEGPIVVGVAHGDYSVAEIKEAIESGSSINIGDKVAIEKGNRLVREIGVFSGLATEETLNDGRPIKTRLNWAIPIGINVNCFAYNDSGAQLNTGTIVDATGPLWVRDY